ncbi:toprim domain-containing protein [Mesorhizobium muleiense]|uniref:toprim domain-containing protein n=1 Tax=Mesorhizobium muleiense TaxID=1004279 RepID=UPI001F41A6DF|nr:toprim domain-containing protein [Mesorhizobium muleiense]MCF6110830.1 toprim domain-containing protein [Mesorhizobium muleiense]
MNALSFDLLERLIRGRPGKHDVACPLCGPDRRSPINRNRPVLRVWATEPGFLSFHCARCGEKGYARQDGERSQNGEEMARIRAEIAEREKSEAEMQLGKAQWLWRQRRPIAGSIAEAYLRDVRGYRGPLPATLGFLPRRGDYPPAMIAAFGIAAEPELGFLAIEDGAVRGVHLTRLEVDGSGKTEDPAKIMIGRSAGCPIVLAPPNDLLGLAIAEGIEDALSVHQATGLGAWAAGSAGRMSALAAQMPDWIDCVTIAADPDEAGQRGAIGLADALAARGFETFIEGLP